ncbi:TonB-dependent receptor [Lysobacter alkalisoli]|uniref:TonB-dependent receptor n=2 Tax=Marilutibacter alkalisoli TaxID=2591633 RepID=A0A514BXH4_9GAMM|nr:TonB-dependent receptor [Lysobacter alkalisoli]
MAGAIFLALVSTLPPAHARTPLMATAAADANTLDTVVVTAAGFEQKITDAPASISVVTREELSLRPYTNLIDALRDIEGIDIGLESTDKNGNASISMRGMPSDYTLVLINGRRQSNVGDIYPNGFGGGQFSFIPPLDYVDRIEIVRGPMSTLYGSDAMGGVINIITRKVPQQWEGSVTLGHTWQQESEFGDARTIDLYAAGPLVADKLGLALRGSWYDRDASNPEWESLPLPDGSRWDRSLGFGSGGRRVANTNWHGGLSLSFTPSENHDLVLDYDASRQKYDNRQGQTGTLDGLESLWRSGNAVIPNPDFDPSQPAGPDNPETVIRRVVQPRVGYTEYQRYERDQLALTHIGRWDIGTSTSSLMYSRSSNLGRSQPLSIAERGQLQALWNEVCARHGEDGYCDNGMGAAGIAARDLSADELARLGAFLPRALRPLEVEGWLFDTRLEMPLGRHLLTVGGQYNNVDMEDGTFGMVDGDYVAGTTQKHRQWAVFGEDNWSLTDALTLTAGLRYDDHNIFGDHLSPRGYLVWTASENWTLKGGISTGYKTPKPNQLHPGITGFGAQGVIPFVGTPGLQPETSTNTEIAAYFDNLDGLSFNATAFFNKFKDKITSGEQVANCEVAAAGEPCVDIGPGWAALGYTSFRQSTNVDRAETYGVELAARWAINPAWTLRGNYTWTESEQNSGTNKGKPIAGNPARHMLNAGLDWRASDSITVSLTSEARSKRYRGTDALTGRDTWYEDYALLNLGASWQVNEWLRFNARINNLLDKDFVSQTCELVATGDAYDCIDDYLIKDQRRSLWLSMNVKF